MVLGSSPVAVKSPGIVENLFTIRLASRSKISKSEKALCFIIEKFVILHGAEFSIGRSSDG